MPSSEQYIETSDPVNFVTDSECLLLLHGVPDQVMCKAFASALRQRARLCYNKLESEWLNLEAEIYRIPIAPIGVILPYSLVRVVDEEDNNPECLKIKSWLDKQQTGRWYTLHEFGSELKLGQQELTKLALDLPDGFEDEISDHGVVSRDWGLHFGRVLVMLPYLLDQALYARVLEEKKLGIEVPRNEEDGSFTRNSMAKSLRLALVDVEGSIYREKAKEMGMLFSDRDRHEEYIEKFLEHLQNNKAPSKN
ncbi:UDP-glycosyltransferase [Quillaja saponaria]|uniref:UDP-glycosyltransferase n=1 Tax=Quillaja saponaria TaxID=32244 RepID=A0AAD7PMZ5_QUISA|nr:UDP-glycosyltransferase [Quillaja saponaria]